MTLEERRTMLQAERQRLRAVIDAAYWAFTRQARAQPPSLVVPEAYARLAVITTELHAIAAELRRDL